MQFPSPQAKKPSWHNGSSVYKSGLTLRSLLFILQFLTASFQSHVCFSMSKYRPAGQRIAWRPWEHTGNGRVYFMNSNVSLVLWLTDEVHWITSRQLSPSPATNRNHSPASLSLQISCSKVSSFFVSSVVLLWASTMLKDKIWVIGTNKKNTVLEPLPYINCYHLSSYIMGRHQRSRPNNLYIEIREF